MSIFWSSLPDHGYVSLLLILSYKAIGHMPNRDGREVHVNPTHRRKGLAVRKIGQSLEDGKWLY